MLYICVYYRTNENDAINVMIRKKSGNLHACISWPPDQKQFYGESTESAQTSAKPFNFEYFWGFWS